MTCRSDIYYCDSDFDSQLKDRQRNLQHHWGVSLAGSKSSDSDPGMQVRPQQAKTSFFVVLFVSDHRKDCPHRNTEVERGCLVLLLSSSLPFLWTMSQQQREGDNSTRRFFDQCSEPSLQFRKSHPFVEVFWHWNFKSRWKIGSNRLFSRKEETASCPFAPFLLCTLGLDCGIKHGFSSAKLWYLSADIYKSETPSASQTCIVSNSRWNANELDGAKRHLGHVITALWQLQKIG